MVHSSFEMSFFLKPITNKKPLRTVNLLQVCQVIRSHYYENEVRQLRSIVGKEEKRRFKAQNLDYITPSGTFSYGNDESLISHSGILCMDLDYIEDVKELKQKLIDDIHIDTLLLFVSPCGHGLKWFIAIDLDVCEHETWFTSVRNYLMATYGLTDKQVDKTCSNVSRACYMSYDPDAFLNSELVENHNKKKMAKKTLKFDLMAWVDKEDVKSSQSQAEDRAFPMAGIYRDDELGKAQAVCDELMLRGANIAESYDEYLRLGFSLAEGLGSDGHDIYHVLCSQSGKYRKDECERKWQECLSKKNGKITIATFYKMAQDAGVDLKEVFNRHSSELSGKYYL
jgi:hypothetical protein